MLAYASGRTAAHRRASGSKGPGQGSGRHLAYFLLCLPVQAIKPAGCDLSALLIGRVRDRGRIMSQDAQLVRTIRRFLRRRHLDEVRAEVEAGVVYLEGIIETRRRK